jgi:hypothetical protein
VKTSHALPPESAVARYGLALASVAAALGLAHAFLYFDLPQPFAADNLPRGAGFHVNLPAIVETNESAGRGSDGLRHR